MKRSPAKIAGWILSLLLALFLGVVSAYGKFFDFPDKAAVFDKMGWSPERMVTIGIVEIAVTVLFLIPRTAFIGSILLTAYLGGAVATHVRIGEAAYFQVGMGVLVWVALGLRDPRIFQLAFGQPVSATVEPSSSTSVA